MAGKQLAVCILFAELNGYFEKPGKCLHGLFLKQKIACLSYATQVYQLYM